jgi:hypothetical protein
MLNRFLLFSETSENLHQITWCRVWKDSTILNAITWIEIRLAGQLMYD